VNPPLSQSPISLSGYRLGLHHLDLAVLTPSALAFEYTLVDGRLSRMVQTLTPLIFENIPTSLTTAHATFTEALQRYPAWALLRNLPYPGWVTASVAQVQTANPAIRLFLVWGFPTFGLTEFVR